MLRARMCAGVVSIALLTPAPSPKPAAWRDPSPHRARLVAVDGGVRLEVLDWGGSGRSVILLAGGGNTAHVFDELAPRLTTHGHVYGITRRGFGASGFSPPDHVLDRLRDDVLAVIHELEIDRPVLVGHSIAGAELGAVATAYPGRLAGLVYLEAGYPYAFDNGKGPTMEEFNRLQGPPPPTPPDSALSSFGSLQRWDAEAYGFRMPEAELRQTWDETSDGRPAKERRSPGSPMFNAIMTSTKRYAAITIPTLAIFALPHLHSVHERTDPAVREAVRTYFMAIDALTERQAKTFEEGVPGARVVRVAGAHHVFLSNDRDVLREMRAFLGGLRPS
jgi:non-heme chloroperoxidase